jgi:hypothetical protein
MTLTQATNESIELFDDAILKHAAHSGRQILLVDDSDAMLELVKAVLRTKYNLIEGCLAIPNPYFIKKRIEWYIDKGINLKDLFKYAVLDIDFGIYNKDVTVNDLLSLLISNGIPVILYSAISDNKWKHYVNKEYHDEVTYVNKANPHAINIIYELIKE